MRVPMVQHMKQLYLIGGTMGAGKTTTCGIMKEKLGQCVFLDGDWCWDMHPFQVTEETKQMVVENICFILNNFIRCSAYQNIVFCWVMHEQGTIDDILSRLDTSGCRVHTISLVCGKEALVRRLEKDVACGLRAHDVIGRSAARIPLYNHLNTLKVDVSDITAAEAAEFIIRSC